MQYSIVRKSELSLHPDQRWDGEYLCFDPYKNKSLDYVPIGDVLSSSQYGVSIEMNEEGVGTKIYRMNEISNMLCNRTILKYAKLSLDEVALYKLKDRDVLFNRTNSQAFVGRTGIFRKFSDEAIVFASYLVRINPDPKIITPECLTAFLNTKYGVLDVKRRARISINQSNVNAEELKRVKIPLLCDKLQTKITLSFDKAFNLIQTSEATYRQAEIILLAELGLVDWRPKHCLSFVKNYSDTKRAGRIDAEYFQPKYEEIINAIQSYPGGYDTLENLTNLKDRNYYPKHEQEYKYIELSNIGGNGEITGSMQEEGQNLPTRARRKVSAGDVIVSSVEGSLDSIAFIGTEYGNALCSTGFYVVNSKNLNSETLLVLLKNAVGQLQLKKGCSGTILTAISKDEFSKIVFPKIKVETQIQIRQRVAEAFALRRQSKYLLESAKRAVELAIEQDEQTAMDWLESQAK